ncbi:hypothetical protein D3C87_1476870 [compost metagenome]
MKVVKATGISSGRMLIASVNAPKRLAGKSADRANRIAQTATNIIPPMMAISLTRRRIWTCKTDFAAGMEAMLLPIRASRVAPPTAVMQQTAWPEVTWVPANSGSGGMPASL